jgi:RimJ/RimL family protein N-acetyltransferase
MLRRKIEDYSKKMHLYLSAFCNSEIVGQLSFRPAKPKHKETLHIGEFGIVIRSDFWGTGLAKHMMLMMEKAAKESNITRIEATVRENNLRGLNFYKKMDYQIEGIKKNAYKKNNTYIDEFYIAKLL